MQEPLDHIPEELYGGDTWYFKLGYSDYTPTDYDLVVYFSSPNGRFSATGVADGSDFVFTVAASNMDAYSYGDYQYQIRAEHKTNSTKFTIGEGDVYVRPPLDLAGDHRHQIKKVLDAIDAVIANRATTDQQSMSIAGRSLSRMSIGELRDFRAWYSQQWERLRGERKQKAFGKSRGNNIRARFT